MQVSRRVAIWMNFAINDLLPPIIRDRKRLMKPLFRIAYGEDADLFMDFRARASTLTEEDYTRAYQLSDQHRMLKGTDLNGACLERIPHEVIGPKVLEAGAGHGVLSGILAADHQVTACDIHIPAAIREAYPAVNFVDANIEKLPFDDDTFDTVVCTHVLEHVLDLEKAMAELRRVARRRIVVVLPRERPYRFGFNLHLTFFPYAFSVLHQLGQPEDTGTAGVEDVGGDWLYVENLSE